MAVSKVTMNLNKDKLIDTYKKRAIKGINKALVVLKEATEANTPEDTLEMVNSYNIIDAKANWDTIKWTLENTSEHAIYVEYGVKGRSYNYHKPKWAVMYTGVGNRTFQRTLEQKRFELFSIISQSLSWA